MCMGKMSSVHVCTCSQVNVRQVWIFSVIHVEEQDCETNAPLLSFILRSMAAAYTTLMLLHVQCMPIQ